jgi:hypothetical protein
MHGYKDLGGIVKGRKRTYRIEIDIDEPRHGEVRIDPVYVVSTFDNDTGELVRKESVRVPDDSRQILSSFVDITKQSAGDDFM